MENFDFGFEDLTPPPELEFLIEDLDSVEITL